MQIITKQLHRLAYDYSGAELGCEDIPGMLGGGIVYHHSFKDDELFDYLPEHIQLNFTNVHQTYAEVEALSDFWLLDYLEDYEKYQ